jgi:hypothetical protein
MIITQLLSERLSYVRFHFSNHVINNCKVYLLLNCSVSSSCYIHWYSNNFTSNNAFIILCLQPIAIAKIRKDFLTDPIFDMNHMRNASAATEKLCEWVMAIEAYDRMVKGSGGTVEESK